MILTILASLLITAIIYFAIKYSVYINIIYMIVSKMFKGWLYRTFKSKPYKARWVKTTKDRYSVQFTFPHDDMVYTLFVDYKNIKALNGSVDVTTIVKPFMFNEGTMKPSSFGLSRLTLFKDGVCKRYGENDLILF
jgi:hypothetical protein